MIDNPRGWVARSLYKKGNRGEKFLPRPETEKIFRPQLTVARPISFWRGQLQPNRHCVAGQMLAVDYTRPRPEVALSRCNNYIVAWLPRSPRQYARAVATNVFGESNFHRCHCPSSRQAWRSLTTYFPRACSGHPPGLSPTFS